VSHGASNCDEGCFDPDQTELIAPKRKVRRSLVDGTFIAKTNEASILEGLTLLSLRQTVLRLLVDSTPTFVADAASIPDRRHFFLFGR